MYLPKYNLRDYKKAVDKYCVKCKICIGRDYEFYGMCKKSISKEDI